MRAETLDELFSEAVRATASILLDEDPPPPDGREKVSFAFGDVSATLAELLEEQLYHVEHSGALAVAADVHVEPGTKTKVRGELLVIRKPALRTEIKAVTYHELDVARDDEGWRATVYFDV